MSLHCIAGRICCIIGDTIVDSPDGRKPPLGLVSARTAQTKNFFHSAELFGSGCV